jgi:membrane protein implicated in regulation of membrane protease activity
MNIMLWLLTVLSLIGVVLNIKKKKVCFVIWGITNLAWAIIDFRADIPAQGVLFLIYFCLAIWGLVEWRTEKLNDEKK